MAFARPTLAELITRTRADFRSRLGISGSLLRRAMSDVLAVVWAGTVHMTHGHLEWLAKQLFADTAIREFLIRIAAIFGITPTPAAFSSGTVTVTCTGLVVIALDEILVRDDGATYRVTAETIVITTGSVPVQAVLAGTDGNLATGETLSFESPVAGADSLVTVEAPGITGGLEEESTEDLRTRLLLRLREPPQGGSDQDYEAWALAVAGVTRAWVYRHEDGLGTVTVRFVLDGETPIIPTVGQVAAVQTALNADRPTTAEPTAAAPVDAPIAFTISISPDTAAIRTAVEAELADMIYREAEPGDGAGRGTVLLSKMRTAIGVAVEDGDYTLTAPAADVVPALGDFPSLGVVTWV